MKHYQLEEMINGWFVGGFTPTALSTEAVEVGVKKYASGAYDPLHYHKIATEITVIIEGRARMAGKEYGSGSIIRIEPNTPSDFLALSDVTLVVVKLPGALNDKYMGEPND